MQVKFQFLLLYWLSLAFTADVALAQSAPLINTDKAASEFISDNARPSFLIKRITIVGRVDTMKAVVKTSTVRSIKGDYARYKPVVDSIWWTSKDSLHHDVSVLLHLEGQGIPLPANYVRGSVRLTVSAAYRHGDDWIATSSEAFTVPVANVEIPRPIVSQSKMEVVLGKETPRSLPFEIRGIRVLTTGKDTVDHLPEVRNFTLSDVAVEYTDESLVTSDPSLDSLRTVELTASVSASGEIVISGHIKHPQPKAGKKIPKLESATFSINVRARLNHRGGKGLARTRTIDVSLFEKQ
jgi:hypothetical protein